MKLACSTAAFPADRLDIAIAKVAWAGYGGFELWLEAEPYPSEEALQRRLRHEELELMAVRVSSLPTGSAAQVVDALAPIGRAAALARALDCGILVTSAPAEGNLGDLREVLRLLDRALGSLAVDVCLVNSPGTLLALPGDFQSLWADGVPSRYGVALDPARALQAGWDPTGLSELPDVPRYVYLNGLAGGRITPPGQGEPDPELLLEALRAAGFAGTLTVDLEGADAWAVEPIAKETREALQTWVRQG